ncbi:MAG: hypothetical protein H7Z43_03870, partial [Clostridia bacterium]|nr:hypothetical protein [Deltaproteobacteria bacterium]
FELIEKRGKLSSLLVNVFVAVVIIIAAYLVFSARSSSYIEQAARAETEAQQARDAAKKQSDELNRRLAELDAQRKKAADSAAVSKKVLDLLDTGHEKEAIDMLDQVNTQSLTELEARLMEKRVGDLRKQAADEMYSQAVKYANESGKSAETVQLLQRSLALDPNYRYVMNVRYLLATKLWQLKRYDEAVAPLRELSKIRDPSLKEEVRFLLGASLAQTDQRDEAKQVLGEVIAARGKYASQAKTYLTAMDMSDKKPADGQGG